MERPSGLNDRQVRIHRHEPARFRGQRPKQPALRREGHRSEVECGRRAPGGRDVLGSGRHLFVRRATQAMDQASQVALVEEPGAHAGSREPM